MIYEIAGLRVKIENRYDFTTKFCQEYLSEDQTSQVHIVARASEEEFLEEKKYSGKFSDGYIENICLYRSLCCQIPLFNRMLLHCAVLEYEGKAYAFLGRSGTGKSTHTRLWKKYLGSPKMVNGDKPILEWVEDGFIAHGTPWRGKESWGERTSAPLYGLCFLEQAKENSIRKLSPAEVSSRLFGQILLPEEEENVISTLELADKLIATTPAYLLKCDISKEAVKLSFEAMTALSFADREQTF
jgi:hypothetical protein